METAMKTGTLSTLEAGSRFTYGGVKWVVLEHRPNAALCLAADVLEERAFDEDNKNDFAASSLRAYLNEEFLSALIEGGADKEAFRPIALDLTSDDGLTDYGKETVTIGLITCDMYRHYRKLIPDASDWWWTCTPWTTERNGNSRNVRSVNTSGALDNSRAYHGSWGVRPLCYLKSDISVSYDEAEVKQRVKAPFSEIMDALYKNFFGEAPPAPYAQEKEEPDEDECDFGQLAHTLFNMYSEFQTAGFNETQAWELMFHFARTINFFGGDDK
ncbi:MAG: DUF6273 domain-containing protein [Christensenellaceae bacterium]|jgi:hypothetical protein|nr:DUF6273 domain-containing protein [Christensenellaceae bacterium]